MPDNDIRTRIARVLWNHLLLQSNPPQCGCGQPITHTQAWNEHVADMLLVLPGVAIVDADEYADLKRLKTANKPHVYHHTAEEWGEREGCRE